MTDFGYCVDALKSLKWINRQKDTPSSSFAKAIITETLKLNLYTQKETTINSSLP